MPRYKTCLLVVIAWVTCFVLPVPCLSGSAFLSCILSDYFEVDVIDAGTDREIRILADCSWEMSQGLLYEV
jgi:hypothetical protein